MRHTKKDENTPTLTLNSKYRILSVGSRDEMIESIGVFRGVVSIGTIDGIALELAKEAKENAGKVRVIPSHMVLAIDILEAAKEEDKKKPDEAQIHYT
ncbi:MAG TPA: hypothetical protein VM889_14710 [Candidatus Thermoplasmatota archaeon]|nr:hypothetical protein [Candidatus Thermoplasmatota archaeon]